MSLTQNRKKTDFIAIHCSATKATQDIGAADIRKWHRQQGYFDIGYHFVIKRDGTLEKGRDIEALGAHVKDYNAVSVGVCLVGGLDAKGKAENNFTPAQWATLRELLAELKAKYKGARVLGHRDFPGVKKDCPCFDVKSWLKTVNLA